MRSTPIAAFLMLAAAFTASAQLPVPPRPSRQIADPANVVVDRGSRLEIFPNQRAIPASDPSRHRIVHRISAANAGDPLSARRLGVIFNHELQQQGYITGEIAFQPKDGAGLSDMPAALYPGLRRITASGIYVVQAGTPAQFMAALKRLQARQDVQWVEPIVIYGPSQ
jgi:hypothetical protein